METKAQPVKLDSREYKFLVKAHFFANPRDAVIDFWSELKARHFGFVRRFEDAKKPEQSRRRDVWYLDTADRQLRSKHYILRIRQKYDGKSPRKHYEFGCKFRHHLEKKAAIADVSVAEGLPEDMSFEEDLILTRDREFISLFSLRNRIKNCHKSFPEDLAAAGRVFPALLQLGLDGKTPISAVNQFIMKEYKYTPGLVVVEGEIVIEPTISVWYEKGRKMPLIAEFSFKHPINGLSEDAALQRMAMGIFQSSYEIMDGFIADGTSKTAYTYGLQKELAF